MVEFAPDCPRESCKLPSSQEPSAIIDKLLRAGSQPCLFHSPVLERVLSSPVCRSVGLQVSEERPRWVLLGWWSTEDHREAGQRTREMLDELGDLRENLRMVVRNIEVGCPSSVYLQRKHNISQWRVYNYITVFTANITKMETMSRSTQ